MSPLIEPSLVTPFIACILITLIHVYFGIHVIERKVIFVDLALAQIAALGAIYAVKMGYDLEHDTTAITLYSLVFTIAGALIFSITRQRREKVPHEAIIGIIYAVASAATIVLVSKSGMGSEEFKNMLARDISYIKENQVTRAAIVFLIVGLFHLIFGRKFLRITLEPERALAEGTKVWLWDFLFYLSFGLVITQAFSLVGVLMVFTYLVIPATIAVLLAGKLWMRLVIGWTASIVISYAGIRIPYNVSALEVPAGPFIICLFGFALVCAGVYRYIFSRENKLRATANVLLYTVIFAAFIGGTVFFGKPQSDPFAEAMGNLSSHNPNERRSAILKLASVPEKKAESIPHLIKNLNDEDKEARKLAIDTLMKFNAKESAGAIASLLTDSSEEVRETVVKALRVFHYKAAVLQLLKSAGKEEDVYITIEMAETILEFGGKEGIPILIKVMADKDSPDAARRDAYEHLHSHINQNTPSDPTLLKKWWEDNRDKLTYDESTRQFKVIQ